MLDVPAGTRPAHSDTVDHTPERGDDTTQKPEPSAVAPSIAGGVPAGTPLDLLPGTCFVRGIGPIEPETARKLACDTNLLTAVVAHDGAVLALGNSQRFVTRRLRRALMVRDHGMCQYPGCAQTRHLKAHHRIHWADGGSTDLANLILLCQWHHTTVHEGKISIHPAVRTGRHNDALRWTFTMPNGHLIPYPGQHIPAGTRVSVQQTDAGLARRLIEQTTNWKDPLAQAIRPDWRGERCDIHAAIDALYGALITGPAPTSVDHPGTDQTAIAA